MRGGPVASDIDAYIAAAPSAVRPLLRNMRSTIRAAAPDAVEAIVYGMPTFRLHGNLVHFAAFAKHIGFYPGPEAITAHATELARYVTSKGAIQFPLDAPLPLPLVTAITRYRVQQSLAAHAAKSARTRAVPAVRKSVTKKAAEVKTAVKTSAAKTSGAKKSTTTKSTTTKSTTKKSGAKTSNATRSSGAKTSSATTSSAKRSGVTTKRPASRRAST